METYGPDKAADRYSDEIDLIELFTTIWRTRYVALAAVLAVSVMYFSFVLLKSVMLPGQVTYGSVIKLTFTGVQQGQYPNGSRFSYQDLIAPNIVTAIHEQHNLDQLAIDLDEFKSMLLVEPYSPQYSLIVNKYQKLMGQRGLSVEKIEALQEKLRLELDQSMYGSAIISLRAPAGTFSEEQVKAILTDIPKHWAKTAIIDKGVQQLNLNLASAKSLNDELFQQIDYMVLGDILNDKVQQIENNIETLSAVNGAATITDPVSGLTLADLTGALSDLRVYVIDELMSPIRSLGLSRNKELSIYYFEDKKKNYNRDLALSENQAGLVREAFILYQSATNQTPVVQSAQSIQGIAGTSTMAQMSADAIDKISNMAGQVKAEEYRQALNKQWLTLNLRAAETRARIRQVDELIMALKGTEHTPVENSLKEKHLARAKSMLPIILNQLRSFFDISQRIYVQLSVETTGTTGQLYQPVNNHLLVTRPPGLTKESLLIWVGLVALALFVVIPATMLKNAMQARERAQQLTGTLLRGIAEVQPRTDQTTA